MVLRYLKGNMENDQPKHGSSGLALWQAESQQTSQKVKEVALASELWQVFVRQ